MGTTLATQAPADHYPAPIRVAYERAALRIGITPGSLEQRIRGHMKVIDSIAILVEEMVSVNASGDAQLLVDPILAALLGGPVEELEAVIPVATRDDAGEEVSQCLAQLDLNNPVQLRRWLNDNDDQIKSSIRLRRALLARLAHLAERQA